MNRGKLLLVIVVILLLWAGVWWYWGQVLQPLAKPIVAPTISQSLIDSISNDTQQQGLPQGYLHANLDGLMVLEEPKLVALKSSLQQKENSTIVPSEKSLLKTYVSLTDLIVELKKLNSLGEPVRNMTDVCDQKQDLLAFTEQLEKTNASYLAFAKQSDEFTANFSYDAEQIELYPLSDSYHQQYENNRALIEENKAALRLCE